MKANEAPKRIWIDPATDLPKLSGHIDKDSIEYIRKDAFIEKAVLWMKRKSAIRYHLSEELIEDFKKNNEVMKVEKHCGYCKHCFIGRHNNY